VHDDESNAEGDHDSGSEAKPRRLPRALDDDADVFDEPLEKAPHYERTDRLDSVAGYLYEDTVEDVWDKHDACGLVWYTDAAFWDRRAGGLDERAHDAWDVEDEQSDGSCSSWESSAGARQPQPGAATARQRRCRFRGVSQAYGFASVRRGVAGKIMRRWGHACRPESSDTLLAVIEGLQPNTSKTGIGFTGEPSARNSFKRKQDTLSNGSIRDRGSRDDWITIGSAFDTVVDESDDDEDRMKRRRAQDASGRVRGSFHADPGGLSAARRRAVRFVPQGGGACGLG